MVMHVVQKYLLGCSFYGRWTVIFSFGEILKHICHSLILIKNKLYVTFASHFFNLTSVQLLAKNELGSVFQYSSKCSSFDMIKLCNNLVAGTRDHRLKSVVKSCFEIISDSSYFLPSLFLEFSDAFSVFPKIKMCLHDWRTNVIHYFVNFCS